MAADLPHNHGPDLRGLRCVGPCDDDILAGAHHSRKYARAEPKGSGYVERRGSGSVRRNLPNPNLHSLAGSFHPTDDGRTGWTASDIHSAERISVIDSYLLAEGLSRIR